MSGSSPDILMDPVTEDLPAFSRHVSGMAVIAQRVRVRLTTLLGNWPLDVEEGIDWISIMGQKPVDTEAISATLVLEMLDTPGVVGVVDIEFGQTGTVFEMTATLQTEFEEDLPVVIEAPGVDGNPSITVGGVIRHSGRIVP